MAYHIHWILMDTISILHLKCLLLEDHFGVQLETLKEQISEEGMVRPAHPREQTVNGDRW